MKVVYIASLLCVLSNAPCLGQLRIDKPVLLTGSATADRQVTGLTPYTAPGDALIASEEQSGTLRFVDDVQGNNWQVSLNSLDVALQPGTQLVIVPPSIANGAITVQVGSDGPYSLEWKQGVAVLGQDIPSGMIISAVFDGNAFQVLNGRVHRSKDCISGMVPVSTQFCVDTLQRTTTDFFVASLTCAAENKRLCTWGEAVSACTNGAQLGILSPSTDYEWVDDTANELLNARVFRYIQCDGASTRNSTTSTAPYRCCYTR